MPCRPAARGLALAALLAAALPRPGLAEDAMASLTARLELFDPGTGAPARAEASHPIGLRVHLTDAATGRPPRGMTLAGWVRPDAPGNTACEDAARAYRVTWRIPMGATDLNGVLLVALNRDGSVGVIDPKLNLQSSNMIAAATLGARPDAMAMDAARMRALFLMPGQDGLVAMSLMTGETEPIAPDLAAPSGLAASDHGGIWAASAGDGHLHRLDRALPPVPVGHGPGRITLHAAADPDSARLVAFGAGGGLALVDGATGRAILSDPAHPPVADATVAGEDAVLSLTGDGRTAHLVYADDPGRALPIPLGFPARRLAASPDGRFAVAFAPGEPAAAIIDLALAQVVQPLELTSGGITDFIFTDAAGYLLSLDGGFAGLIDLASIHLGRGAQIRQVDLARTSDAPPPAAQLLVPLWPTPQVLAVDPETQTGWILHDDQAVGEMPPMDSLRLRGGVPHAVAVADRSLREVADGVFETVTALPGGPQQLVLTTGIGGMTACIGFRVRGGAERTATTLLSLGVRPLDGDIRVGEEELAFTFRDPGGTVIDVDRAEFLVPSLTSSWATRVTARRAGDGTLRARIRFPHAGPFAVQPLGLPPGLSLKSATLLEVQS